MLCDHGIDFDPDFYDSRPFNPNRAPVWTTGEGQRIPIDQMEDSHLLNTIAYLVRRKDIWARARSDAGECGVLLPPLIINDLTLDQWLANFYAELRRRGA